MGMKAWNFAVLGAVAALWVATGTQREKPVVSEVHAGRVRAAEDSVASAPHDPQRLTALAQSYLDARAPGMAVQVIESAPADVRGEPSVLHVYARALIDQGHAAEALQVERKVLDLILDKATYTEVPLEGDEKEHAVSTIEAQAVPGQMQDPSQNPPAEGGETSTIPS